MVVVCIGVKAPVRVCALPPRVPSVGPVLLSQQHRRAAASRRMLWGDSHCAQCRLHGDCFCPCACVPRCLCPFQSVSCGGGRCRATERRGRAGWRGGESRRASSDWVGLPLGWTRRVALS